MNSNSVQPHTQNQSPTTQDITTDSSQDQHTQSASGSQPMDTISEEMKEVSAFDNQES